MVVRNTLAFTKVAKMPYKKLIPANPQTLGDHIKRKRLQLRLLQKEVAEKIGVSEDSITGWENGRSVPQIHLYPAIIVLLGYYPFEKDITTVSGQIEFVRFNNGWSYERRAMAFSANATAVLDWHNKNKIFSKSHKRILETLLQQCLSK